MTAIRMEDSTNKRSCISFYFLLSVFTIVFILAAFQLKFSVSQYAAIFIMMVIYEVWSLNRVNGLFAALVFEIIKPLLVRVCFNADYATGNLPEFDILGFAPSLILIFMIVSEISRAYFNREIIFTDRPRRYVLFFIIVAILSIFNPNGSIFVGMAGFQRNMLPTMLIMLLSASLFKTADDWERLKKLLSIVGIISIVYGLLQFTSGILPWEKLWFQKVAFKNDVAGWLTIGFRGIEFRIYSFFYSYAGFFYTNVLIFSVLYASSKPETPQWIKIRKLYFLLWFAVLAVSMERMASIMTLSAIVVISYFKGSTHRKRNIVIASIASISIIYGGLIALAPVLESTGVTKLIRLAELANPLSAGSIEVRRNEIWAPAIDLIKSHPLGMGLGFGSATIAGGMVQRWSVNVQPHNEILQKTLETGLIGGLVYCLLLISMLILFKEISNTRGNLANVGAGMMGGTVAFILCGMLNLTFSGTPGIIYWTLAGAALGLKDNAVSVCNITKHNRETADKIQGRLMQDETIKSATITIDI